jgi:hypothetical protein
VRLKTTDLRARVNAPLVLRFQARGLTSYAGLELIRRYWDRLGLARLVRDRVAARLPGTDYGATPLILLLLTLIIVGGRRLAHLAWLERDPLVLRICGLARIPTARSVGRWLEQIRMRDLGGLVSLNEEVVAEAIRTSGVCRLTIDVDGSVVSTGLTVEGARRGYNPHDRKAPSYYPITAHEAQTGQILRVQNRSGNVHDGKGSLGFLRSLFGQIRRSFGDTLAIEFRMDGAFFRRDVIDLLHKYGAEYAIKVPFYHWVGLKPLIAARKRWTRVNSTVDCFEKNLEVSDWGRTMRVVIYRRRVRHEAPKNYQLDLFDPADGHYEYSAVVTNKNLTGAYLWYFQCGRGSHEKAYAELKGGFAFDCLPSRRCAANSAWQMLSVLAFNLMRSMQVATTATRRTPNRKRRVLFRFASIQTLRYQFVGRAGIVVKPGGCATLDVGNTPKVVAVFREIAQTLARAA